MNAPPNDEEDQGEIFLEEDDIIHEINVDEEDLPDVDEEAGSDADDTGMLIAFEAVFCCVKLISVIRPSTP